MSLSHTKRPARPAALALTLLACLAGAPPGAPAQDQTAPTPRTERQRLEEEKLRQEIVKLQLENRRLDRWGELLLPYGTLFTVLVGAGGLIVTFWKQINENARQREMDRQQRQRDLEQQERNRQEQERGRRQREEEGLRRLEERFSGVVSRLGSQSPSIQASAAVSMMPFLNPENREFHAQAFLILLANLKLRHRAEDKGEEVLTGLLVTAFERAARALFPAGAARPQGVELDLARCTLYRADLSGLDLTDADFAFSDLRSANLTSSVLFRSRGIEANMEKARLSRSNVGEARFQKANFSGAQFHESSLVAADLKGANLRNAQLQQARLQSTHFEGADLSGARFEQADLSDAFFQGATLTSATLRSVIKAKNWRKAHWDAPVLEQLNALAGAAGVEA